MSGVTEFYRWWIINEVSGERVLTPYKLTRAHAALAFPRAVPDLPSREVRDLPDLDSMPWAEESSDGFTPGDTVPMRRWSDTEPG